MLRRLRIYFIGFGLGLIMVYVLFLRHGDRDLDFWTPDQRVLEAIRMDSVFHISQPLICFTDCLELDSTEVAEFWTLAKVKSLNPGGSPYRYLVSLDKDGHHLEATIEQEGGKHRLLALKSYSNPKTCDC